MCGICSYFDVDMWQHVICNVLLLFAADHVCPVSCMFWLCYFYFFNDVLDPVISETAVPIFAKFAELVDI